METEDYKGLSFSARSLLLELAYQYRGNNNGDLSATFSMLKPKGFGSPATINKALRELEAARMIQKSREGRFMNPGGICCLYALTWKPVDECGGKIDIPATITPLRKFSLEQKTHTKKCNDSIQKVHRPENAR